MRKLSLSELPRVKKLVSGNEEDELQTLARFSLKPLSLTIYCLSFPKLNAGSKLAEIVPCLFAVTCVMHRMASYTQQL